MKKDESHEIVALNSLTATGIEKMILVIRDKQVLLDRDLAMLYGVETKRINEQVKRNIERFPEEFCFQLNLEEASCSSKSQMGMRTNSWTQLEDASCHTRKNRRQKPWKSFMT